MEAEDSKSGDSNSIWPSSDDDEPCPPCPVEMPVVKSLKSSTNTSHATLLSSIVSDSDTESVIQLEFSQPLPSRDVSTPPYSTEFNAAFKSNAQPFEHMVEPTSRSSKIENLDDKGPGTIRIACDKLASSCINCWCNGLKYHSHRLVDCPFKPIDLCNENWKKWRSTFRLPISCCFFCGCPQKVSSPYANLFHGFLTYSLDDLHIKFRTKSPPSRPCWQSKLPLGHGLKADCIHSLSYSNLN